MVSLNEYKNISDDVYQFSVDLYHKILNCQNTLFSLINYHLLVRNLFYFIFVNLICENPLNFYFRVDYCST